MKRGPTNLTSVLEQTWEGPSEEHVPEFSSMQSFCSQNTESSLTVRSFEHHLSGIEFL